MQKTVPGISLDIWILQAVLRNRTFTFLTLCMFQSYLEAVNCDSRSAISLQG